LSFAVLGKIKYGNGRMAAFLSALALCIATPVGAALYEITFNDGGANAGSGQIDVESANNNSYAASGYLDVTAGQALGDWVLYAALGTTPYPHYITSPLNAFLYNNAVYPTGQNPQYPISNPLLDEYGLLFTRSSGNGLDYELNLWGNADGSYTLGSNLGGQTVTVNIRFGGTTITPIPEPITYALAVFGLVFVGVGAGRFYLARRRSATAG
jgi:hypothetical protein